MKSDIQNKQQKKKRIVDKCPHFSAMLVLEVVFQFSFPKSLSIINNEANQTLLCREENRTKKAKLQNSKVKFSFSEGNYYNDSAKKLHDKKL